jgi:large subunit ribosomal protein L6
MYSQELSISENLNIEISGNKVKISGPKGELEKNFKLVGGIKIKKVDNKIKVSSESERRKIKSLVGTMVAHIRSMIRGVTEGFVYKLRVVYSHFPITVKVEGDKILIQNFLGEKTPRVGKIVGDIKVKVGDSDILVSGINREDVGQTAANIEQACRITGYDRRRFMDGVYIVSKGE